MLIKTLDIQLLIYLSKLIDERRYRDFIGELPECLAWKILRFLTVKDLAVVCQVSSQWCSLANNNEVWKVKYHESFICVPRHLYEQYRCWKEIYRQASKLHFNWSNGYAKKLELCGHKDKVLSLSTYEDLLATGSTDNTIKVWILSTAQLKQTLVGHKKSVWCVHLFSHNIVISGSHDTTIRIWNIEYGTIIRILLSHRGPVWQIACQGDLLLSTSQDMTCIAMESCCKCMMSRLVIQNALYLTIYSNIDNMLQKY
ncbi:F-box/WD repeat-containing protein sel-10 [Octopus bimaculoides]|uniref:F-box domain-containing protein n=1 Tax=Octopus bimaculoides TaxID=37653 RepID=A0A0L8HCV0_OCTBM|nr:F-box/WD repeat-containing protein sel-10 [Octopus bimaculoides]|eukprot:XP_014773557.1 PREDICTED: F-box/WD repeat-containing protein sel-10-like [Octopus bimaculoides]